MNIKNSGLNKQYLVSDTILFQLWQEEIIFLLQKILLIPILREYLILWFNRFAPNRENMKLPTPNHYHSFL